MVAFLMVVIDSLQVCLNRELCISGKHPAKNVFCQNRWKLNFVRFQLRILNKIKEQIWAEQTFHLSRVRPDITHPCWT